MDYYVYFKGNTIETVDEFPAVNSNAQHFRVKRTS